MRLEAGSRVISVDRVVRPESRRQTADEHEERMKTVTIYTDGACSGNPGPGGWCAILEYQRTREADLRRRGVAPPTTAWS